MSKPRNVCIVCGALEGLLHFFPIAFLFSILYNRSAYHAEYEQLPRVPWGAALRFAIQDYPSWFLLIVVLYQVVVVINLVCILIGVGDRAERFRLSLLSFCGAGILFAVGLAIAVWIAGGDESVVFFILEAIFHGLVFAVCLKVHLDEKY